MPHLDHGVLHALLDGEIPSAELVPIRQHLDHCAECRARLAEEQDLVAVSDQLIEMLEVPAAGTRIMVPSVRRWPRNLAWAASVIAAAGLGYAGHESGGSLPVRAVETRAAESTPPVAEAAPPPPAPAPISVGKVADQLSERRTNRPAPLTRAPRTLATTTLPERTRTQPAEPARLDSALGLRSAGALRAVAKAAPPRRLGDSPLRLEEAVVPNAAQAAPRPSAPAPVTVSFPDAIRLLGGTIRLIPGLVPTRLEAVGRTVRVIYTVGQGELVLSEELVAGTVTFELSGPPGFPADSLTRLRERVRD